MAVVLVVLVATTEVVERAEKLPGQLGSSGGVCVVIFRCGNSGVTSDGSCVGSGCFCGYNRCGSDRCRATTVKLPGQIGSSGGVCVVGDGNSVVSGDFNSVGSGDGSDRMVVDDVSCGGSGGDAGNSGRAAWPLSLARCCWF